MLVNTLHKVEKRCCSLRIKTRVERNSVRASCIQIRELISANDDILFTRTQYLKHVKRTR